MESCMKRATQLDIIKNDKEITTWQIFRPALHRDLT